MYNSYFSQVNIITHYYFLICKTKVVQRQNVKLTSEYDQMRFTTITACNNYNKVY